LSDAEDVKVLPSDPQGEVLVHLGSSNYLERYKVYVSHVREWRQQFDKLESVDLRYDGQIIVNPDLQGTIKQPPLSKSSAKIAMAAGMKPAALITQVPTQKSTPVLAPASKPLTKAVAKKVAKKSHHKVAAKATPAQSAPTQNPSAQNQSAAKTMASAAQSPSAPTTNSSKTTPTAPPATGTVVVKPGSKPSPSIAKGEDHP
jgi:cell division protein FtsQ